jgi:hypothetical protein
MAVATRRPGCLTMHQHDKGYYAWRRYRIYATHGATAIRFAARGAADLLISPSAFAPDFLEARAVHFRRLGGSCDDFPRDYIIAW